SRQPAPPRSTLRAAARRSAARPAAIAQSLPRPDRARSRRARRAQGMRRGRNRDAPGQTHTPALAGSSCRACAPVEDPALLRNPRHRAHDSLLDAEPRTPAKRVDAPEVKMDERIVADPAAVATRIDALRCQAKIAADPAN